MDCGHVNEQVAKCYYCHNFLCMNCLYEEYGKHICDRCASDYDKKDRLKKRIRQFRKELAGLVNQLEMIEKEI